MIFFLFSKDKKSHRGFSWKCITLKSIQPARCCTALHCTGYQKLIVGSIHALEQSVHFLVTRKLVSLTCYTFPWYLFVCFLFVCFALCSLHSLKTHIWNHNTETHSLVNESQHVMLKIWGGGVIISFQFFILNIFLSAQIWDDNYLPKIYLNKTKFKAGKSPLPQTHLLRCMHA